MIPPSAGSFLLVFLVAALSVPPALAAPRGRAHTPHSPWKDYRYDPGSSHKRLNLNDPENVGSCVLSAADLLGAGDKEFVFEGARYSQVCLEQLALTFDPKERAACRTECPACVTVRGYNMPCIAERALRSNQLDLTQSRDIEQLATRMAPTAATDCAVPPQENLPTPSDGGWSPFTTAGHQAFDNDCLTRYYLDSLSSVAPCPPDDNACMLDRALEFPNAYDLPNPLTTRHLVG